MALNVVMVTGPRRSGKSTLITALVREVCTAQPHYVRLAASDGSKRQPNANGRPYAVNGDGDCGVATATWISYDPDRVFETLPETLAAVHARDRQGCVLIEADTDANLRHAYPYDTQIFTLPAPERIEDVFRTPAQVLRALRAAMHDTSAFAGEMFGLQPDDDPQSDDGCERRPDMSDSQIASLMHSPLGAELASRVQCHPDYHGVIESDAVVVNTGVGGTSEAVDEVVRRLEDLARRAQPDVEERSIVFCCDLCDEDDPRRKKLLAHFARRYNARE